MNSKTDPEQVIPASHRYKNTEAIPLSGMIRLLETKKKWHMMSLPQSL